MTTRLIRTAAVGRILLSTTLGQGRRHASTQTKINNLVCQIPSLKNQINRAHKMHVRLYFKLDGRYKPAYTLDPVYISTAPGNYISYPRGVYAPYRRAFSTWFDGLHRKSRRLLSSFKNSIQYPDAVEGRYKISQQVRPAFLKLIVGIKLTAF
jgi:hypothetical protein